MKVIKMIEIKPYQSKNPLMKYLKDIINNLTESDAWNIQLTIASADTDEQHIMHSKIDNIES